MVQNVQDCGFHKLSFHDRGNDFEDRLLWEDQASFRNCVNASGKVIAAQILKKIFRKNVETAKVIHIIIAEVQIFHVLNNLFKSGCDCITGRKWVGTVKYIKNYGRIVLFIVITLHHSQFV